MLIQGKFLKIYVKKISMTIFIFTGTDSPQAVRKLMSLSEPGKTRQRIRGAKHSVSSLHSINSPPGSPPTHPKKVKGHERSQSDSTSGGNAQPVSLSAESSSVTSVPARKQSHNLTGKFSLKNTKSSENLNVLS